MFLAGAYGVRCAQGRINMISTGSSESHLNSELTKSYMDASVSSLDSSSRKT